MLDCLANRRETFQAGTARINAVRHTGNRMAKHARRVRLRACGSLEASGNGMPEAMEAKPVTLQAERFSLSRKSSPPARRSCDVRCTTALPPKAKVHRRSCYVGDALSGNG
jgi:hypothetical protein